MSDWREKILKESAQIATLTKNSEKIHRVGKKRRTFCKGGCGRRVWTDYCRKCSRKMARRQRC